jgi:hypothetical protein
MSTSSLLQKFSEVQTIDNKVSILHFAGIQYIGNRKYRWVVERISIPENDFADNSNGAPERLKWVAECRLRPWGLISIPFFCWLFIVYGKIIFLIQFR